MSRPNTSTDTDTSERLVGCCSHCCTNISWTSAVSVPLQRQPQHPAFRVSPLNFFERSMRAVDDKAAGVSAQTLKDKRFKSRRKHFDEKHTRATRHEHSRVAGTLPWISCLASPGSVWCNRHDTECIQQEGD